MKTLFSNDVFSRSFFAPPVRPYAMQGRYLGQNDISYIDADSRAKVISKVDDATKRLPALNDVVALSQDMNLYRSFMGTDYGTFLQLSNDAAALYPGVKALYDRFSSDSAEDWYATGAELDAVDQWSQKITQMYQIFLVHFPQNAPMKPIPATQGPTTGPAAVAPKFPVLTPTGVPKPMVTGAPAAMIPGAPSPAMVLGMDANNLLIGGGLAVALGVLIYAIA